MGLTLLTMFSMLRVLPAVLLMLGVQCMMDPRQMMGGMANNNFNPNMPEDVQKQQAEFLHYEDEYFQLREVDPQNGEFSDRALEVLGKMLAVSPVKFQPNLMKANWLLRSGPRSSGQNACSEPCQVPTESDEGELAAVSPQIPRGQNAVQDDSSYCGLSG